MEGGEVERQHWWSAHGPGEESDNGVVLGCYWMLHDDRDILGSLLYGSSVQGEIPVIATIFRKSK